MKEGGFDLLARQVMRMAFGELAYVRDMSPGDSPIEKLMFASIISASRYSKGCLLVPYFILGDGTLEAAREQAVERREASSAFFIEAQVKHAGWRVDFLITYEAARDHVPAWKRLIVECDGHDFHERTKDQAARDRSRDRGAQIEGYGILRFTGSEIWSDPLGCGQQVVDWVSANR